MAPKYTRKEYESIPSIGVGTILDMSTVEPKKKEFVEERSAIYHDMVKIEEKKRKLSKKKQQKALKEALETPGLIDSE